MAPEKTVIAEHAQQEKLVPVLTYVYGLTRPKAISAMLSFLAMCHNDCSKNNTRLRDLLTAEDEKSCMSLLDKVIDAFLRVENLSETTQARLVKTVYKIMKKLQGKNLNFLRDRFITLCGEHSYETYWKKIERAPDFEAIERHMNAALSVMQRKRFVDFSIFFIAFVFLYGCGEAFYERLSLLEEKLKAKYGSGFPFDSIGLCLWPLDFSFVQDEEDEAEKCEHRALLKATRAVNPDVKVLACVNSLLWSRDVIAWLTDDYDLYAKSAGNTINSRFGRGALNEGGNIITGMAKNKFILVAREPLSDNETAVDFYYEMFNRDIKVYTLPDGFLWSRDPETGKDLLLDSIHIDSVINVVPAQCTIDGHLKIIVDPYYYASSRKNPEFGRFLIEQRIPDADIVIVDERELYLNLANFSVLFGPEGERKLLFNKDKGLTIPRLKLKADALVQPDIEITRMASCYGSIRCAATMLPLSYVKDTRRLKITFSKGSLPETKKMMKDLFHKGTRNAQTLSKLWVSKIHVRADQKEPAWEFDEFSRTLHIALTPAQAAEAVAVNDILNDFGEKLSKRMGIVLDLEIE
ncbi:MAG: hypothetical protein WBM07_07250 [Chitinivibrionales bacterium]